MAKISIVMATYNRRQLLINSLKTIEYYNKDRDIEVIVVDDASPSPAESILDIPKLFKIPIIVIPITKEEKNWKCDCNPFNIGFSFMSPKTEIVIIQNPENLHVGDIIGYGLNKLRKGVFLSFGLYSMNQADSDNVYRNAIKKGIYSGEGIKKVVGRFAGLTKCADGETCWYNHSVYQPSGHHLISAITRKDLEELGGFDERYASGFAYTDFELRERIKRKGMITKIIDEPFAIHQRHTLAAYGKNKTEFTRNGELFVNVTLKEKIFHAPKNYYYKPMYREQTIESNKISFCPISKSKDSFTFVDLGDVPLVNNLCNTREQSLTIQKFPLAVQMFRKSKLSCLTEVVNKDKLFLNYVYQSGVNRPYLDHCTEMYHYLNDLFKFNPGDLIIDIGGNDGSLLLQFKKENPDLDYINIDASQSFIEINQKAGISYVNKYFDEHFLITGKKACVITSTNVFQHTYPIRSFVRGIFRNLESDGVWCLEFPYLLTTLLNDNYDQIYHEHCYYYLLQNIIDLLRQEGMKVINVTFHEIHSGTLRVLSVKETNPKKPDHSINSFLSLEKTLSEEYYLQWGQRTLEKIKKFREYVLELKNKGFTVACFGAAAKGCVFLNTCGLDYNTIKFIVDDTPFKQGKYVPGTGLQVVSREVFKKEKIDYLIILAHNFKDYIINSVRKEYKGKFVVMFPDISIL